MSPFPTLHSIYLNIGFWQGSFVWKCYAFICSTLNQKAILQFLKKSFSFQKTCFKVKVLKKFKIPSVYLIKTCQSLKWRAIFKISSTVFWRCSRSFYWFKNKTSSKKLFLVLFKKKTIWHFGMNFVKRSSHHFSRLMTLLKSQQP